MKLRKSFINVLLIAGLLFTSVTSCDKTDDPGGDFPSAATVKDVDGNNYNTVKIGTQIWTSENLKTTKYNDGSKIPNVTYGNAWAELKTGAYCNYDNGESNAAIYGRLYNWHAVNTGKLAPAGWHVPTDEDWIILINYLIENGYNYDGTKVENKIAQSLCAKTNWEYFELPGAPGVEPKNNNSSGFTALPGGYRSSYSGIFHYIGYRCYWWSSTEYDDFDANHTGIGYDLSIMAGDNYYKEGGFSVRLVKD
jgi:uncharacterized protein (TIGR02145 family)